MSANGANEKVSTIPYAEFKATVSQADGIQDEGTQDVGKENGDGLGPGGRDSEATSVSSMTEFDMPVTNGTDHSYAAAVKNTLTNGTPEDDGSSYPPLPDQDSVDYNEKQAWRAGGIRFAPARVPMTRRLQTAAVLFHSMSIILLVACFWFTCANPFAWPILIPYLLHLTFSTIATNGNLSFRSEYLRSLPLWTLMASYFPAKLHKTHDLSPNRKYILGYHPHGIISHGAWLAFATNALGFKEQFPGITNSLLTLDNNFRLPFHRDWLIAMGVRSVSKESIWNSLTKGGKKKNGEGNAVTIVIGGARESLEGEPGSLRLILKSRKGFIKMALRTGADLVPVLAFGENDLYDQLSPKTHPLVHKIQMFTLKVFKFTLPFFHARGLLNYDIGLMPYRKAINVVVGKPIEVNSSNPQPSQEDIDRLHALYVREIEKLWEAYKDQFAKDRTAEMQILA